MISEKTVIANISVPGSAEELPRKEIKHLCDSLLIATKGQGEY